MILNSYTTTKALHIVCYLQIAQELGGQEDWELEVIAYSGARQQVRLQPGEALLYESAKLLHGRPRAFRGRVFANAFIHFSPVGWDYHFDPGEMA